MPANLWSRALAKTNDAYNATKHSVTGMMPDVSFYCAMTDSREEAIRAGLKENLLQGAAVSSWPPPQTSRSSAQLAVRGSPEMRWEETTEGEQRTRILCSILIFSAW